MTTVHSNQCGRDIQDVRGGFGPLELAAPGDSIGRSAKAMTLEADGCADPLLGSVSLEAGCDPADFPWLAETRIRARFLYALGVRNLETASYLVNGRPSLQQTVLVFTDAEATAVFRTRLEHCGAKPVASPNGGSVIYRLSGEVPLAAQFDGRRLVVLQGLDGKDKSRLLG